MENELDTCTGEENSESRAGDENDEFDAVMKPLTKLRAEEKPASFERRAGCDAREDG